MRPHRDFRDDSSYVEETHKKYMNNVQVLQIITLKYIHIETLSGNTTRCNITQWKELHFER